MHQCIVAARLEQTSTFVMETVAGITFKCTRFTLPVNYLTTRRMQCGMTHIYLVFQPLITECLYNIEHPTGTMSFLLIEAFTISKAECIIWQ